MADTGPDTAGDFSAFYQRHITMVYQICLMMLKHVPDAEDAAQTIFRRVLETRPDFRDPEHEKAWLIVAARNECKNQLKHWWRTQRVSEEALNTLTWEQPRDASLWQSILALPEKDRMTLYLHYYQGYSTAEMAEILGKNPSTVRTWLVQARRKLKEQLEADNHG